MYGKTYWGVLRATFIIDADGVVAHVIPKASPKTHDEQVLALLAADDWVVQAQRDVEALRERLGDPDAFADEAERRARIMRAHLGLPADLRAPAS